MNNREKYTKVFMDILGVKEEELKGLKYQDITAWDSVGHMSLVAALEDELDIMMEVDDIIDLNSFEKGMEILKNNYEIEF